MRLGPRLAIEARACGCKPSVSINDYAAAQHDYQNFYNTEIQERSQLSYPPFSHFVKISSVGRTGEKNRKNLEKLADKLRQRYPEIKVLGPAPSLVESVRDKYRWQLLVATNQIPREFLKGLPAYYSLDIDPLDLF